MRKTHKTDPNLTLLIQLLRKAAKENDAPIWKRIAIELQKSRRRRPEVNVGKFDKFSGSETLIIPGKVLGDGFLTTPKKVAAYSFSASAKVKITEAGGQPITIMELLSKNPQGSNIRIVK